MGDGKRGETVEKVGLVEGEELYVVLLSFSTTINRGAVLTNPSFSIPSNPLSTIRNPLSVFCHPQSALPSPLPFQRSLCKPLYKEFL